MTAWTVACLSAVSLSFLGSGGLVIKLVRHRQRVAPHSALYQVLAFFFGYLALWNLLRWWFYLIVLLDASLIRHERSDALGIKNIHLHPLTNWRVIAVMILGDAALISTSLWLLAMTRELYLLAKITMDRGAQQERIITKRYVCVVHLLVLVFAGIEVILAVVHQRYNAAIAYITMLGMTFQTMGVVYLGISLCMLRRTGRNLHSVHGLVMNSPLYVRLRNLVVVFMVFSFQYQVFSLLFVENGLEQVSTRIIGVSTVLFRLTGAASAFVMGISQELVVKWFHWCIPTTYVDALEANLMDGSAEPRGSSAPTNDPVFVYTDIESSSELWSLSNEQIMQRATEMHDDLLRSLLVKYRGYEITTVGDAFQLAFGSIQDAVEFCSEAQLKLLELKWPKALDVCGVHGVARQRRHGKLIFAGLRVRMGIHDAQTAIEGPLVRGVHPVTGRVTYTGISEVIASEISDWGHGGQILMTARVGRWVANNTHSMTVACGARFVRHHTIASIQESVEVHQMVVKGLEARVDTFRMSPLRKAPSCLEVRVDVYDAHNS